MKRSCFSLIGYAVIVAFGIGIVGIVANSQMPSASEPWIRVEFTNAAISPSHWILEMRQDGRAHFHSDARIFDPNKDDPSIMSMPAIDRDLQLTQEFVQKYFNAAREHNYFEIQCEAHNKVAFQGTKKITYTGPDGNGSCQFNFSTEKHIQDLGDSAMALAASVTEGFRLQSLQMHDRLGLDREMEFVTEALKDGRMQQIGVIRDELECLASDDAVLERVRHRARQILTTLALGGPGDPTNPDKKW